MWFLDTIHAVTYKSLQVYEFLYNDSLDLMVGMALLVSLGKTACLPWFKKKKKIYIKKAKRGFLCNSTSNCCIFRIERKQRWIEKKKGFINVTPKVKLGCFNTSTKFFSKQKKKSCCWYFNWTPLVSVIQTEQKKCPCHPLISITCIYERKPVCFFKKKNAIAVNGVRCRLSFYFLFFIFFYLHWKFPYLIGFVILSAQNDALPSFSLLGALRIR